jgi:hypothetical protein
VYSRLFPDWTFVDPARVGSGTKTAAPRENESHAERPLIRASARARQSPDEMRSDGYFLQGAEPLTVTVWEAPPVIGFAVSPVAYGRLEPLHATDAIEVWPLDD